MFLLLGKLKKLEILKTPKVEKVMLKVDRADYCPKYPYLDED